VVLPHLHDLFVLSVSVWAFLFLVVTDVKATPGP
jgi:hypothetical protein